ncbi:MAG: helix-turn-helix domain-containing protein [Candidatus Gribaldobacteria bacterium]|nr:helix-turn-helix domain-containing protein [Candidatus Gribaldobacteria bacterium]
MELKEFYTTKELAELIGVSRVAVFNRIKKGDIKAQKMGRNFVIFKKDIGDIDIFLSNLFKTAKEWALLHKKFPDQFYCQDSGVFQARVTKMGTLMMGNKSTKDLFPLLVSVAGEIGNNSYDHNLGQWLDIPGIFFGYDLNKKQIVLADRGLGILKTLKRVRPDLKDHEEALKMAFTEMISGREPEARGNGLKYVRNVIAQNPINLIFQTGNAKLTLNGGNSDLDIKIVKENISGCLALITY